MHQNVEKVLESNWRKAFIKEREILTSSWENTHRTICSKSVSNYLCINHLIENFAKGIPLRKGAGCKARTSPIRKWPGVSNAKSAGFSENGSVALDLAPCTKKTYNSSQTPPYSLLSNPLRRKNSNRSNLVYISTMQKEDIIIALSLYA